MSNTTTFMEKWLAAVDKNNSVLCAGLDPAEASMGRGEKGLPEDTDKFQWAMNYLKAVAPFVAAVKPNVQYWKNLDDMDHLNEITAFAHRNGLVVIDDSKLADIGPTNDAGLYHSKVNGFDAVTLAPFAGNLEEMAGQCQKRKIGGISMCLMSNPEYEAVKNGWEQVDARDYQRNDLIHIGGDPHVRKYVQLARDAQAHELDGIVIGAPSAKNHITEGEIAVARHYAGDDMLVLLPGIGEQGGKAAVIWKYFAPDRVIVNVGRSLMFPKGSNSTAEDHAEAANHYQSMLNDLRTG